MAMLFVLLATPATWTFAGAMPDVLPKAPAKPIGILVLDDCDPVYKGKAQYSDNLTLLNSRGGQQFRISGFNNCETIGSSRMVAVDVKREHIWVIENVAHRIRRFDPAGKETLSIGGVHASSIAVDPATGNLWSLEGEGAIGKGKTVIYDTAGKRIDSHDISGWDIVYDPTAKAFWIAETHLTKIVAATGAVSFSRQIANWCASSIDIDPNTGVAWVTVRAHRGVSGSFNALLKFDAAGQEVIVTRLGDKSPFRVSVDRANGSVWVAHFKTSVERFSADGTSEMEHIVHALTVLADPVEGDVWVVTPTNVLKLSSKGALKKKVTHAGETSQAWIAGLD